MNIYDDIDLQLRDIPPGITDVETMLLAASSGIILYPLVRAGGRVAVREYLVKLAATVVSGIELMDAEDQDQDECEHP